MKSFLYVPVPDIDEARSFYGDVLGLEEIYHADGDRTTGYVVGTLQLAVTEKRDLEPRDGWAMQLGWTGGDRPDVSFGIEIDEGFAELVERVLAAGVATRNADPQWVGYWSFPVKDPAGNTVEISAVARAAWPGSR